nr:MAG TPA: hypothetical protein [Caudoviricetes sp.]
MQVYYYITIFAILKLINNNLNYKSNEKSESLHIN